MYQMKKGGKPKMQDGGNSTGAFSRAVTVKKATYDSVNNKIKNKLDSTRNAFEQKLKDMKQKPKMAKGGFPDLTGDGKVTKADILKGRGVFKKGGMKKMQMGGKTSMPSVPKPSIINPRPMDKSMTSPMKKGGMVKSKKK